MLTGIITNQSTNEATISICYSSCPSWWTHWRGPHWKGICREVKQLPIIITLHPAYTVKPGRVEPCSSIPVEISCNYISATVSRSTTAMLESDLIAVSVVSRPWFMRNYSYRRISQRSWSLPSLQVLEQTIGTDKNTKMSSRLWPCQTWTWHPDHPSTKILNTLKSNTYFLRQIIHQLSLQAWEATRLNSTSPCTRTNCQS